MQADSVPSETHLPAVTMLRGLASLAVCFMHFCGTVESKTLNQIGQFGSYGVQIFFIISGFILPYALFHSSYKIRHYHQFVLKRLLRLDPPYLLSILGIFLLSIVAQNIGQGQHTSIEILSTNNALHVFYLVDVFHGTWLNPVFWTLAIEFQFYLLLGLIFPLILPRNVIVRFLFFSGCIALPFLWKDEHYLGFYAHFFTAGFLLFTYQCKRINFMAFYLCSIILLAAAYFQGGYPSMICISISYAFLLWFKKSIRLLVFLGTISYSLYLIHTPFGTDGLIQLLQNYITSENGRMVLMFCAIPVTIAAAWLFYLLVEKPSIRWAKKIIFK